MKQIRNIIRNLLNENDNLDDIELIESYYEFGKNNEKYIYRLLSNNDTKETKNDYFVKITLSNFDYKKMSDREIDILSNEKGMIFYLNSKLISDINGDKLIYIRNRALKDKFSGNINIKIGIIEILKHNGIDNKF
jgi:hypothetical protein